MGKETREDAGSKERNTEMREEQFGADSAAVHRSVSWRQHA